MISVFDLFKIGIGPSSSHTVGPMRAARRFALHLKDDQWLADLDSVRVTLYGSLALTGKGHGTDKAILLGLLGERPEMIDPAGIDQQLSEIRTTHSLAILGEKQLDFDEPNHLIFNQTESLPFHVNGMRFEAFGSQSKPLTAKVYYSVGGGFVVAEDEISSLQQESQEGSKVPFPFKSAVELMAICQQEKLAIWQVMLQNELSWRTEEEVRSGIIKIWQVMQECVQRGITQDEVLPGGLNVKRRAPKLYQTLVNRPEHALRDPLTTMDWVNLYALAVNEENAAGGRVVTAPTNGAAGIIPAVLHYYYHFSPEANLDGIIRFFLTAAAIGVLYKENASISGAEVGCQGEVGVACSMAAAGLAEVRGGSIYQVENAAEIGMEHNLGLTCDPVNGLVQIPCIERNAMGAIKAINASRIALRGDGEHYVSLDSVIATMRQTGEDMNSRYKETSLGGLAVNMVEC
ncbi:MAG TPA: L-serine ammonia-lyase [Anaerolineales bacterium]|jgi:L-serine dehydratase|nr:L-serine ammonia-lyase [Anaerolineales bacterium]